MRDSEHGDKEAKANSLSLLLAALINLGLAALQLVLFLPLVGEGRSLDLPGWLVLPYRFIYRADSLALAFGAAWAFALGLTVLGLRRDSARDSRWAGISLCLMSFGMLSVAYARDPWALYLGWEVAGLGLWWALRPVCSGRRKYLSALSLHILGWPLLLVILLGLVSPFAPPVTGSVQAWPVAVAVAFGVVVLARSLWASWAYIGWPRANANFVYARLPGLYAVAAPYLVAKALVAAPWDAVGVWVLALLGTIGVLGGIAVALNTEGVGSVAGVVATMAAISVIGFGLAPGSLLAAAGAIWVMLAGLVWVAALPVDAWRTNLRPAETEASFGGYVAGPILLLGALAGVWLISQGALNVKYGLIAAILLPVFALLALIGQKALFNSKLKTVPSSEAKDQNSKLLLPIAFLTFAAIFPQSVADWVLRPSVQAMAGVSALQGLESQLGVGLLVRSQQETVLAALPATGMALAVFLAFVALYWLKRLALLLLREPPGKAR